MGDIIWPKREQKHAKEVTCDLMMIMKEGLDFLKAMDLNTYYILYNDTIKCYYLVISLMNSFCTLGGYASSLKQVH